MLLNSEKKVLVFGTGSYAKDIYPTIQKMGMDIIGFVDNDITKQKRKLFGIKIISPEKISEAFFNYIVIASTFYIDIHSQLTKKLSVPERKILFSCKSTNSIELWNPPSGMICESNAVFTTLQKSLPKISRIAFEVKDFDFYGTRKSLEQKFSLNFSTKLPISWMHGWVYSPLKHPHMIASEHISTRDIALTNTPTECDFLIKEGYQNVHCVGARFLYLKPEKLPKRIEGSTLLVPTHSTRYANNHHTIIDSISKFAEESDYDRDLSVVCLSGQDSMRLSLHKKPTIDFNYLPVISGAWIHDLNAFQRMWSLFSSFEYILTDSLGSHIPYAMAAGCKVKLSNKLNKIEYNKRKNDSTFLQKNRWIYDVYSASENFEHLRKIVPIIFEEKQSSEENADIGRKLLGYDTMVKPSQLQEIIMN